MIAKVIEKLIKQDLNLNSKNLYRHFKKYCNYLTHNVYNYKGDGAELIPHYYSFEYSDSKYSQGEIIVDFNDWKKIYLYDLIRYFINEYKLNIKPKGFFNPLPQLRSLKQFEQFVYNNIQFLILYNSYYHENNIN